MLKAKKVRPTLKSFDQIDLPFLKELIFFLKFGTLTVYLTLFSPVFSFHSVVIADMIPLVLNLSASRKLDGS